MAQVLIQGNGTVSLGSVESEEDLKLRPGININPPSEDGTCDCCGRHISELKPFGKAGDPLVGDFDGAFLVKTWRRDGPYDNEAVAAMEEAESFYRNEGFKEPLDWMVRKYGKERGEDLHWKAQFWGSVGSSWECRDCIILNEDGYFAKLRERGFTNNPEDFIVIPQDELRSIEELREILQKGKPIDD